MDLHKHPVEAIKALYEVTSGNHVLHREFDTTEVRFLAEDFEPTRSAIADAIGYDIFVGVEGSYAVPKQVLTEELGKRVESLVFEKGYQRERLYSALIKISEKFIVDGKRIAVGINAFESGIIGMRIGSQSKVAIEKVKEVLILILKYDSSISGGEESLQIPYRDSFTEPAVEDQLLEAFSKMNPYEYYIELDALYCSTDSILSKLEELAAS